MDRRGYPAGTGLLVQRAVLALILAAAVSPLGAQSGGGSLKLSVETDPALPEPGRHWIVTIVADHPTPTEVRVQPPALPPLLRLERVRIMPRLNGGSRQTVVEYDFLVLQEGLFTLGPFELTAPGKRGLSPPLTVRSAVSGSSGPAEAALLPQLFWAGLPGTLRVGEAAELTLRYAYPSGVRLPAEARSQSAAAWSYRPEPPLNAIVEVLPGPPQQDPPLPAASGQGETGILLRLRVIPLEGPALSLPETRLTLAGRPLTVPALKLPIAAAGR